MAPSSFQDSNENKMWLRQKGSVKEFNAFFDDATSNIQLPERYLFMTYVAGLKREIADSVRLFQPRTMREARSIARAEEISIQWLAKKARKELEDQEEGLAAQESDGSSSFNTQECFVNQAASVEHEPEEQEPSVAQETNDDDHEVSIIHDDDASSKPISDVSSSVLASLASVPPISSSNASILNPQVSLSTNGKLGVNGSLSFDPVDALRATSVATSRREASKFKVEVGEPKKLDFRERFQEESHKTSSCSAPLLPTLPPTLSIVFVCSLPRTILPSSLSLFVVNSPVHELSQVERNSCASKENMFEGAEWQDLGLFQVEKSNLQLFPIFVHWLCEFEKSRAQLSCTLLHCQRYFYSALNFYIPDECLGFKFHSPISLQFGIISPLGPDLNKLLPAFLLCSPTRILLQIWFKGELIKMLLSSGFLQCDMNNNLGFCNIRKGQQSNQDVKGVAAFKTKN